MELATAWPAGHGQGWRQVGELALAFVLAALIGLERQRRGKSAGMRTQTIVGTTSALILLVSKYGFGDVLASGTVVLDPSRVAAQVVSGIGFLGAGLIITRRGSIRGLTTAAAVWETAAIGLAAGAGLPLLAVMVTVLHFVAVVAFTKLAHRMPGSRSSEIRLAVRYLDGQGLLRQILASATGAGWQIGAISVDEPRTDPAGTRPVVAIELTASGSGDSAALLSSLAEVDGVLHMEVVVDDEID